VNIPQKGLRCLRAAVQNNEVSFPSQVPVFANRDRTFDGE
jgi:hypothetical protein